MSELIIALETSLKLQHYHKSLKRLMGDQFPIKIKFYTDIIRGVMAKRNTTDVLATVLHMSETDVWKNFDAVLRIWFFAAAVEIIEQEGKK
ncbi:MAG: hypothetical protein ACM3ME_06710 [Chloroflexota bacterium]